ncbi:MAG: hypothetical protein NC123_01360 [Butyrivibrio sp.]|nr:hypothetical protein [Acetatifactor muris]MCM1558185.1 hypothetical protein [Butyrivibrio sp.]
MKGCILRIDSSTVGMESAGSYKASNTTVRRFMITDYQQGLTQGNNALNTAIGGNTGNAGNAEENTTEEGKEANAATLQDWQTRFQTTVSSVSIRSSVSQTYADIKQQTIRYIFDLLFSARRNRLNRWMQENGIETGGSQYGGTSGTNVNAASGNENGLLMMQPGTLVTNMKVLSLGQETYFEESESASFSTTGTVKTADGREISFNVNVGMSREFQEYYREDLELASFTFCDPLVINLDTDVAQLEDQTFYFDIDGDGEEDEVSQLGAGSGYLALDKNDDGVINDGKELFGTESGNGFADLAKYDQDGNGWIDENDAVWDKLKIWTKDENGKDVLYTLADKGVGAICLQNVSTDFTQKGAGGQTLGAVRNTGVFLYENGNVGTVQHVDVAKYEKQA